MDANPYTRSTQGAEGTGGKHARVSCDRCSAFCFSVTTIISHGRIQELKSSDVAVNIRRARDVFRITLNVHIRVD